MGSILQKVLRPDACKLHLAATTKDEAIREMIDIIEKVYGLNDRADVERVIFARERSLSTGMQDGVAIPHGKTDTVDGLLVAFAIKPEGLDFNCVDGQLARIFIMTLSPVNKAGPHIQFLAEISNLLRHEEARKRVLKAASQQELYCLLTQKKWE